MAQATHKVLVAAQRVEQLEQQLASRVSSQLEASANAERVRARLGGLHDQLEYYSPRKHTEDLRAQVRIGQ